MVSDTRRRGEDRPASQPLAGITVVEMGTSVAAPFAAQILGDLGARVVKVEKPDGGDDARSWGPPFWHGTSATFQSLNRNKHSVALDLKAPAEREALRTFIVEEADVVIQNMRPGLVTKYRLDSRLTEDAPRLVYCNLGAFGSHGPLRDRPGYDPMMQAFAGLMNITGEAERPPVRIGPSIIDIGSGMWCAVGIVSALYRRELIGRGGVVDTSLFETALAWMTIPSALTLAGAEPVRTGSEAAMLAPYKAYMAGDGQYLIVAAGNDKLFQKLCDELGRPEWREDDRFRTNAVRLENRHLLNDLVEQEIGRAPASEWIERLEAAGVPCAPLQSIGQVMAHPQTEALGMMRPVPDSSMVLMASPLRFDGQRPDIRRAPPTLGQDTELVLKHEVSA